MKIQKGFEEQDLHECVAPAVTEGKLDSILVPKVESPDHLLKIDTFLKEKCSGGDKIKILAAIESAFALIHLKEICSAVPHRLEALIV